MVVQVGYSVTNMSTARVRVHGVLFGEKRHFDNCRPRQSEESNIPSMRGAVSRVWTCLLWLQGCLWVCDILFFCFFNVLSSPVHFSGCKLLAFRTVLGRADNSVLWGVL